MATISESLFPWIDEDDLPPRRLADTVDGTRIIAEPAEKPASLWTSLASRWHRAGTSADRGGMTVPDKAGCCPCHP